MSTIDHGQGGCPCPFPDADHTIHVPDGPTKCWHCKADVADTDHGGYCAAEACQAASREAEAARADECANCGMIDVPLVDGHCVGCTCASCGRTAEDAGGSMNDMGWCDRCEERLHGASLHGEIWP